MMTRTKNIYFILGKILQAVLEEFGRYCGSVWHSESWLYEQVNLRKIINKHLWCSVEWTGRSR